MCLRESQNEVTFLQVFSNLRPRFSACFLANLQNLFLLLFYLTFSTSCVHDTLHNIKSNAYTIHISVYVMDVYVSGHGHFLLHQDISGDPFGVHQALTRRRTWTGISITLWLHKYSCLKRKRLTKYDNVQKDICCKMFYENAFLLSCIRDTLLL